MTDRDADLNSAGFVHASGWIRKWDLLDFIDMVESSRVDVANVIDAAEKGRGK